MRKLLTILFFITIGFVANAQYPFLQTLGNTNTIVKSKGALAADSAFIFVNRFTDTASANLSPIKFYSGAIIRTTGDTLWMRNTAASRWNQVNGAGGGGSPGGSSLSVQYNDGGAFGGSANLTYNTLLLTSLSAGLGTTQDDTKGLVLINTTAAAAGAQQISPALRWSGQGWKTAATAASQEVEFRQYVLPIQATNNPDVSLLTEYSRNGAAYIAAFTIRGNQNGTSYHFGNGTTNSGAANTMVWFGSSVGASGQGSIILSSNATSNSSNTFIAGGQNTIIDAGATGAHSLGTDGHIYAGALYAFIANDANEAWGESAAVFGFGNDVYDDNGFSAGSDNDVGHTSSGLFSNGFAIGNANQTAGNAAGALGQANNSSANNAITIGRSNTSSAADAITIGRNTTTSATNSVSIGYGGAGIMTNSEASSFAVGFNTTVPSFRVSAGSGAGTYGQTYIYGAANFGIAGTTLGSLNLNGNTSGTVTVRPAAAAGTWTLTLPVNDGDADQVLRTDGSGATSWVTVAAGLTVGTTAITSGTSGRILYDNAGVLGETAGGVWATSGTHLTLTAQAATDVPLNLVGAGSQSANYFNITANGGSAGGILKVTSAGETLINGVSDKGAYWVQTEGNSGFYGSNIPSNASLIEGNMSSGSGNYFVVQNGGGTTWNLFAGGGTDLILGTANSSGDIRFNPAFTNSMTVNTTSGTWAVRNAEKQGADVASVAGAIAVGTDGNTFELTGTNSVTLISNLNWQNGSIIYLVFTSTATLVDGTANSGTDIGMELLGNANFVGSADDVVCLVLSEMGGTQRWRMVSSSVN